MEDFLSDITTLGLSVREEIGKGPLTGCSEADTPRIVFVLNQVLASKLISVLRYKQHFFSAEHRNVGSLGEEFLVQAGEESERATLVALRVQQLGGLPDFTPTSLTACCPTDFDMGTDLEIELKEDLVAVTEAIGTYASIIAWLGTHDPATSACVEKILRLEEELAEDMNDLLTSSLY